MASSAHAATPAAVTAVALQKNKSITRLQPLFDQGLANPADAPELQKAVDKFSVAVTPTMLDLMDSSDRDDPIARQFIPDSRELDDNPLDVSDPIGDAKHSPLNGIVHRYPDRLLLLPVRVCAVYCRFCFRRETIGANEAAALSPAELEAALDYIRDHDEVWEVILSGGDPLTMSPRRLAEIIRALDDIDHVRVIRIHTRIPVVSPERINESLVAALKISKPVYAVLHTNHARELSDAAIDACNRLTDNGIPVLSQSVLLKGINDDAAALEQLFRKLVAHRIKPYYLHHPDRAPGTAHFRISVEQGQRIMKELRGRISGLCLPEYVLDIPGGHGKSPIGPEWTAKDSQGLTVTDFNGEKHRYEE